MSDGRRRRPARLARTQHQVPFLDDGWRDWCVEKPTKMGTERLKQMCLSWFIRNNFFIHHKKTGENPIFQYTFKIYKKSWVYHGLSTNFDHDFWQLLCVIPHRDNHIWQTWLQEMCLHIYSDIKFFNTVSIYIYGFHWAPTISSIAMCSYVLLGGTSLTFTKNSEPPLWPPWCFLSWGFYKVQYRALAVMLDDHSCHPWSLRWVALSNGVVDMPRSAVRDASRCSERQFSGGFRTWRGAPNHPFFHSPQEAIHLGVPHILGNLKVAISQSM